VNTKSRSTRRSPISDCGAMHVSAGRVRSCEILDVVRTHQFAVTKRRGSWDVIRNGRAQTSQGGNQASE